MKVMENDWCLASKIKTKGSKLYSNQAQMLFIGLLDTLRIEACV